jgi:pre-mRNA-splicing factor CWC22
MCVPNLAGSVQCHAYGHTYATDSAHCHASGHTYAKLQFPHVSLNEDAFRKSSQSIWASDCLRNLQLSGHLGVLRACVVLVQELSEHLGLRQLIARLDGDDVKPFTKGIFPRGSMADMRFAINYFTAIGLGGLTDALREDFAAAQKEMKEIEMARMLAAAAASDSSGSSSSSSDSSGSSGTSSDSTGSSSGSDHESGGGSEQQRSSRQDVSEMRDQGETKRKSGDGNVYLSRQSEGRRVRSPRGSEFRDSDGRSGGKARGHEREQATHEREPVVSAHGRHRGEHRRAEGGTRHEKAEEEDGGGRGIERAARDGRAEHGRQERTSRESPNGRRGQVTLLQQDGYERRSIREDKGDGHAKVGRTSKDCPSGRRGLDGQRDKHERRTERERYGEEQARERRGTMDSRSDRHGHGRSEKVEQSARDGRGGGRERVERGRRDHGGGSVEKVASRRSR